MSIATFVSALVVFAAVQVEASSNGTVPRQETIYRKYAIDERVELQSFTEPVYRQLQCAVGCMEKVGCRGFQSSSEYPCQLLQCVNPNLYNLSTNDVSGKTAYLKYKLEMETNLARGKPASQSSEQLLSGYVYKAAKGVDGIYLPTGNHRDSLVHTLQEYQLWWRVNLEDVYCIWAVNILNRQLYYGRTKNAIITVADTEEEIFYTEGEESNFCNYHDGTLNKYYTLITCRKAIRGQFVQILLNATAWIQVHEVEVHGL